MSSVIAAPDCIAGAANDLGAIGTALDAAHTAATAPTTAVLPAAADEVSANIAHVFSAHAQGYQELAGQAAAFHQQFVQNLTAAAGAYAGAEAANAASLRALTPAAAAVSSVGGGLSDLVNSFLSLLGAVFLTPAIIVGIALVFLAFVVVPFLLQVLQNLAAIAGS
ncbi:MAG: PE domain-containing protein [Mycobacterium sp.]|uniref:PE family protein n=1 Tax=Mycobacterium sp. TaxID=1785 RepID=UPI001EC71DCE|nr:PE domain-containing protein [Mycobacterium sp.]MBW0019101.1 PE domain-containing protein [Mycobacterium sp.]